MKRILALLLAMVMSLTLLAGCGSTQPDAPVSDVKAVTVEKASFPLTIEDQLGNSVTLEKPAERIVSGYYISSSACIALGLSDKIIEKARQQISSEQESFEDVLSSLETRRV